MHAVAIGCGGELEELLRSYSEGMYEMYADDEQGAPPVLQDCILIPALLGSGTHLEIHWTRLEGMASLAVLWKRNEGQKEQKKKNIRKRIFIFFKCSSFLYCRHVKYLTF